MKMIKKVIGDLHKEKVSKLLAVSGLICAGLLFALSQTVSAAPSGGDLVTIHNKQFRLARLYNEANNNVKIVKNQGSGADERRQQWELKEAGKAGQFYIINKETGYGLQAANKNAVTNKSYEGRSDCVWEFLDGGYGYYYIRNVGATRYKYLRAVDGNHGDNAEMTNAYIPAILCWKFEEVISTAEKAEVKAEDKAETDAPPSLTTTTQESNSETEEEYVTFQNMQFKYYMFNDTDNNVRISRRNKKATEQDWMLEDTGKKGLFYIVNRKTGFALQLVNKNAAAVKNYKGLSNCMWEFLDAGSGYYYIKTAGSSSYKYLRGVDGNHNDNVQGERSFIAKILKWKLEEVDGNTNVIDNNKDKDKDEDKKNGASPILKVSPSNITVHAKRDDQSVNSSFQIWNNGGGVLHYQVSENTGLFDLSPYKKLKGTSTGASDKTTLTIHFKNYSKLALGKHYKTFYATDGAGNSVPINVTLIVTTDNKDKNEDEDKDKDKNASAPVLKVSPEVINVAFKSGSSAKASFQVWNSGTGTLTYKASEESDFFDLSSYSGSSKGSKVTHNLSFNKTSKTGKYESPITIKGSDGTSKTITVSINIQTDAPPSNTKNWTVQQYSSKPHYAVYKNKPILLASSGEHYGALLNASFNYNAYFAELHKYNLNQSRLFSGYWRADDDWGTSLNLSKSGKAPTEFIAPWALSNTRGGHDGKKFDLTKWNSAYFKRLESLMKKAEAEDVIVEFVFFCVSYKTGDFNVLPMHPDNCIQGGSWSGLKKPDPKRSRARYNTLVLGKDGGDDDFVYYQERFVREVVRRLKNFPNVYYEIANEPTGAITTDPPAGHAAAIARWHDRMVGAIVSEERTFPAEKRHMIAADFTGYYGRPEDDILRYMKAIKDVNIVNVHYRNDVLQALVKKYPDKIIAMDETAFIAHPNPKSYPKIGGNIMSVSAANTQADATFKLGGGIYSGLNAAYNASRPTGNTSASNQHKTKVKNVRSYYEKKLFGK